MIVRRLGACTVRIFPDVPYLETIFAADGAKVPAAPNHEPADVARAAALGYGGDTWQMTLAHEQLHTFLAQWLGEPYSPTLRGVALGISVPPEVWGPEEGRVLALQALLNHAEPDPEGLRLLTVALLEHLVRTARLFLALGGEEVEAA